MRNLVVMLLVGLLGFGLSVDHAEAKRFGGGKSFGSYSRSASSTTSSTRTASTPQRRPSKGLSRFAGPFAGLLAGGLLASLFFGGAFDELRLVDILLVAGAIWLAFRLFGRRKAISPGGPQVDSRQPPESRTPAYNTASGGGVASQTPDWFDKERFLSGAKEHFMTLQRAWDNNDFSGIQEYVTPELYNMLREERANHPANNRTDIVRLIAELGDIREHAQQAEATVLFHGIMDENSQHNEFNETWHLVRDLRDGAPWYLQGIEQNPGT